MLVDNSQPKVNVRLFVVGRVNSEDTLESFFGKVVRGVSVIQNSNSVPKLGNIGILKKLQCLLISSIRVGKVIASMR